MKMSNHVLIIWKTICVISLHWWCVHLHSQPIVTVIGISYPQCCEQCSKRPSCVSFSFNRKYTFCKLYNYDISSSERVPGLWVNTLSMCHSEQNACAQCNDSDVCKFSELRNNATCQPERCNPPEEISGADLYGNMFITGYSALYRCSSVSKKFAVKCLPSGVWSFSNLYHCGCIIPDGVYAATLEYTLINETFIELGLSCSSGYDLLQIDSAKCNMITGEWFGKELTGCYKMVNPPWRKIYSFYTDTDTGIVGHWRGLRFENNLNPYGQFHNSSVYGEWSTFVQKRIRMNILEDWTVVKSLTFKGLQSTSENWFSHDRLLESSWDDLKSDTPLQQFSLLGKGAPWLARFLIMQNIGSANHCMTDTGWLTVTWNYYPCDENTPEKSILYAKGKTIATFTSSELAYANRFEVWIEE